jgi:hypothetical protein
MWIYAHTVLILTCTYTDLYLPLSALVHPTTSSNAVPSIGSEKPALLALGFSPWLNSNCSGESTSVLGHGGMGGCFAFADLDHHIAVCVLKSSFSPVTLIGTGSCPSVNQIAHHIHSQLKSLNTSEDASASGDGTSTRSTGGDGSVGSGRSRSRSKSAPRKRRRQQQRGRQREQHRGAAEGAA